MCKVNKCALTLSCCPWLKHRVSSSSRRRRENKTPSYARCLRTFWIRGYLTEGRGNCCIPLSVGARAPRWRFLDALLTVSVPQAVILQWSTRKHLGHACMRACAYVWVFQWDFDSKKWTLFVVSNLYEFIDEGNGDIMSVLKEPLS